MNSLRRYALLALTAVLAAAPFAARAQYSPSTPARPFPGYLNERLRASDPYMNAWDIGVNVRERYEGKDDAGFTYTGQNADFRLTGPGATVDNNNGYLLARFMPRVAYTAKLFAFTVEGRASASAGDERGNQRVAADVNKPGRALAENDRDLNLHQVFLFVGNHKEFPLSLKLGRQELVYGDQRLVGHFRWNNNARTFDAAKIRWQNPLFGVDAFTGGLVYNDNHNFNQSHYGKDTFSGLYFNFPNIPGLSANNLVEAFVYSRNVTAASARVNLDPNNNPYAGVAAPFRNPAKQDLATLGVRFKSKPLAYGPWDYTAELMHQFGNRANTGPVALSAAVAAAARLHQDAYAAVLAGGYTLTKSAWQHRFGLTYSYASGDKSATDQTSQTFQNLFATTHLFYGYMDLNSLQNLNTLRFTYSVKPLVNLSVNLDYHVHRLARASDAWYNVAGVARAGGAANAGTGYAISPAFGKSVGQELDLTAGWHFIPSTQLEIGVSRYFRGDYIKKSLAIPGSKNANYVYVQVTLSL
jgi:Alginate export